MGVSEVQEENRVRERVMISQEEARHRRTAVRCSGYNGPPHHHRTAPVITVIAAELELAGATKATIGYLVPAGLSRSPSAMRSSRRATAAIAPGCHRPSRANTTQLRRMALAHPSPYQMPSH